MANLNLDPISLPWFGQSNRNMDIDLDCGVMTNLDEGEATDITGGYRIEKPPWNRLPYELIIKVLSYLSDVDKENVEATCTVWKDACQEPMLWRSLFLNLTSANCLTDVTQACRTISGGKGCHLRHMTVRVWMPSIHEAWLVSHSATLLFQHIASQASTTQLNSLRVCKLNSFASCRFYRLSTEDIIDGLENLLRSQRHLQDVDLSKCQFGARHGMQILTSLGMYSSSRYTLQRLNLCGFFQPKYQSIRGGRLKLLLLSRLIELSHLAIDAQHVDSRLLHALAKKTTKSYLKHIELRFGNKFSPNFSTLDEKCWDLTRRLNPDLTVTFVFQDQTNDWCRSLFVPSVPLTELRLHWPIAYRQHRERHIRLAELLNVISDHYSGILTKFRLHSDLRSTEDIEGALVRLARTCHKLVEYRATLKLPPGVYKEIQSSLLTRSRDIRIRLEKRKMAQNSRKRARGV